VNYLPTMPYWRVCRQALEPGGSLAGLGLPRSARLPLLARLHQDLARPILLVTNRADRALALYEELQFWLGEAAVHYFPEPNPLFYEKSGWGAGTRRDRLLVLTMLARLLIPGLQKPDTPPVIVAPVRAIMTRTLPKRDFLKHTRALKIGQQVTPEGLTRAWVDTGYTYANIVVETGQFSRRGGLLDVWAPGEALPVRIEFFGDEIDTMRAFDPATQRTVENLETFTLTPAREILPVAAEKAGLALKDLSEFYLPLAHPLGGSLVSFLPMMRWLRWTGRNLSLLRSLILKKRAFPAGMTRSTPGRSLHNSPHPFSPGLKLKTRSASVR
jgi:transcription-repair coupling factor (superfamily II helicase)